MGSDAESESKLAAPKLFGRKKQARPAQPVVEPPAPAAPDEAPAAASDPVEAPAAAEPDEAPTATAAEPVEASFDPAEAPAEPVEAHEPSRPARGTTVKLTLPTLSGTQATAITGLIVGAFLVLATYGALHLCSTVRGATTCGGRAGFPLLLAIGLVAVLGGGALLRAFHITSPVGDSFLAVALVAVLTVLFLHNHYDAWWMLLAVPLLTIAAYLLAHWVSVTYIDPVED
ncbi:hypothetical protein P5P86_02875 [Nocardioides sp. BP30]|uniref:hypothetical protein n=1 Tax=Nocardioides sp. BP30 TaxID=3036374 RepID=UPI002469031C|nr:hypothetical protein [Nocardioides sp. BP30]WGL52774.1 hypothetical protein P5P86_02875 [Nocardioides sp. BP30]